MDEEPDGAVRGCLFALALEAGIVVAGWLAWRLLQSAFL
jgi:hypothetical protein